MAVTDEQMPTCIKIITHKAAETVKELVPQSFCNEFEGDAKHESQLEYMGYKVRIDLVHKPSKRQFTCIQEVHDNCSDARAYDIGTFMGRQMSDMMNEYMDEIQWQGPTAEEVKPGKVVPPKANDKIKLSKPKPEKKVCEICGPESDEFPSWGGCPHED